MNNRDTKLIWEAYDERLDNPHHQREVRKLERENPDLDAMRKKAKEEMAAERRKKRHGEKEVKTEDFGDGTPDGLSPSEKMKMAKYAADEHGKGPLADKDDRGVHGDRPDAGGSLSDYDLKIVVDRDKELDEPGERYGPDTYEIRATSKAAAEQFGSGIIDRVYRKDVEHMSDEELEQMVIRSLHDHGKPLFFRPYNQ